MFLITKLFKKEVFVPLLIGIGMIVWNVMSVNPHEKSSKLSTEDKFKKMIKENTTLQEKEETSIIDSITNIFKEKSYEGTKPLTQEYLQKISKDFGSGSYLSIEGCENIKLKGKYQEHEYCIDAHFEPADIHGNPAKIMIKIESSEVGNWLFQNKDIYFLMQSGDKFFKVNDFGGLEVKRDYDGYFTHLLFSPDFKKVHVKIKKNNEPEEQASYTVRLNK